VKPIFIAGLGRSGTSILRKLLHQDPALRTPSTGRPFPDRLFGDLRGRDEPHGEAANAIATQWIRITRSPDDAEVAGDLPAEDSLSLELHLRQRLDHVLLPDPDLPRYVAAANADSVYAQHNRLLQALQWRQPGRRWFGKSATYHLTHLPALLRHYPTPASSRHRDPLRIMSSVANLLAPSTGSAAPRLRRTGLRGPARRRANGRPLGGRDGAGRDGGGGARGPDHRFPLPDLIADPVARSSAIYRLRPPFGDAGAERIPAISPTSPRTSTVGHDYTPMSPEQSRRTAPHFRRYQERYGYPDEI